MKNYPYRLTRRHLLWGAGLLTATLGLETLRRQIGASSMSENKMPVLFIGHGNPMNAIQENAFTQSLARLGGEIQKPKAILCVSAHWLSAGTWVTRMDQPKTIHDFYGFPDELFAVRYPAPGSRALAEQIQALSARPKIQGDDSSWGLDHGTWAILRKMYPEADIPVVQLSIDMSEPPEFHMELGKTLSALRQQGVLIVGSGNIVHNLRKADWNKSLQGFDWAIEFDEWTKQKLIEGDYVALAQDYRKTLAGQLSVPTPDHYYPLLYTLGAADPKKDQLQFEFEGYDMGSISMRCFTLGKTT